MVAELPRDPRRFRFETSRNVALISWRDAPWDRVTELRRLLDAFRAANPDGCAILNLVSADDSSGVRAAWARMSAIALTARDKGGPPHAHLGTAHLFCAKGIRGATMRALVQLLTARGDFAAEGNELTRTVAGASDWLLARLQKVAVHWQRAELIEVLERFLRGNRSGCAIVGDTAP